MASFLRRLKRARKLRALRANRIRNTPPRRPPAQESKLLSPEEYVDRMRAMKAKGVRNVILTFDERGELKELDPNNPDHLPEIEALGCECPVCQEIVDPKKEKTRRSSHAVRNRSNEAA